MASEQNIQEWVKRLQNGDRRALSRAITITESSLNEDRTIAAELLKAIQPHRKKSLRIGITGSPGVGKSTFINTFVSILQDPNHRIAILTIDPSSGQTGGSILGDKIRMKDLIDRKNIFVRPSPSKGILGGIGTHTWESIQLCEAARYDFIFIETVGVGQSEIEIQYLADEVWWITMPRSGDEIQGMKKGILEIAKRIIVTKADLDPEGAKNTRIQLQRSLKTTQSWNKELSFYEVSALDAGTLNSLYQDFKKIKPIEDRKEAERYWFDQQWNQHLVRFIDHQSDIQELKEDLWMQIRSGKINQWQALDRWKKSLEDKWKK